MGNDTIVSMKDVIGIFDLDNTTISSHTRHFLSEAQKKHLVINVSMELPKSFILCQKEDNLVVYISQISPATLLKRSLSFSKFE
ncbi:extracellular matrix regulator RemB [Scatolibacter rhodanostii]|uniref:extracellular matrix regulator RemB n=1 Tax=Scatolibacter rhodanostii TaxID=2014781 RepID=UPI00278C8967|nr:extracellular matrix/biofilm biosynthesis regulator RemA family protein [Scatolibacter rhodanostii]